MEQLGTSLSVVLTSKFTMDTSETADLSSPFGCIDQPFLTEDSSAFSIPAPLSLASYTKMIVSPDALTLEEWLTFDTDLLPCNSLSDATNTPLTHGKPSQPECPVMSESPTPPSSLPLRHRCGRPRKVSQF